MKVTWLGHSCFKVDSADGSVVFDPYAPDSAGGWVLPPVSAHLTLCSHGHRDHFYPEGVTLASGDADIGVLRIASYHDDKKGALRGENLISVVTLEGKRIAHLGDLGHELSPETIAKFGRLDLLLIPVGGHYTIDADFAKRTADALAPRLIIPMHYRIGKIGYEVISELSGFIGLFPSAAVAHVERDFELNFDEIDAGVKVLVLPPVQ